MAKTWGATAGSTDFVITTVNVPDRLDVQEVRAREDEDDERTGRLYIDWYAIRTWIVRLAILGLIVAAGVFAWDSASPLRDELSAERISERLSRATGLPVKIGETGFRFTPTPRFLISNVEIGTVWRTNVIAIHFNWEDAWRAVRGGGWVWGEASVAPTVLTPDQGEFVVRTIGRLNSAIPASISTIRFESVELKGVRELPGLFEGVARRNADGVFSAITLKSREANTTLSASVAPGGEAVGLQFDASGWAATVGPSVAWNEVHASLRVRPGLIEVPDILLAGFGGSFKGSVYAAGDVEWVVTGALTGAGLDIESMLARPGSNSNGEPVKQAAPFAGTASTDLLLAGRAPTLSEAIDATVASGPVRVKWAALQGINLGYVASRPGSSGGTTRFTDLTGWVSAGPAGISFQDLTGKAGALSTYGEVAIGPDRRVSGSLRVDLGGARIQAPLNVRVKGTLSQLEFGR